MTNWALPTADRYFADKMTDRGFEIDHLDRALEHVTSFRTAIDGGAHVGSWACTMAERFQRVIAFEPAPDTWQCLVTNTAALPNVIVRNAALGNESRRVIVDDDPTRPGNTGARFVRDGDGVAMVRIDELELTDLDFLKLDVEGFEYFALLGATATIARCKPVIVIEDKDFRGRFALARGAANDLLRSLGMREIERVRNDCVFTFA
jgi:FkbM family methyltransferase